MYANTCTYQYCLSNSSSSNRNHYWGGWLWVSPPPPLPLMLGQIRHSPTTSECVSHLKYQYTECTLSKVLYILIRTVMYTTLNIFLMSFTEICVCIFPRFGQTYKSYPSNIPHQPWFLSNPISKFITLSHPVLHLVWLTYICSGAWEMDPDGPTFKKFI